MSVMLNPYLNFAGTAREAMSFYQSIFGGELKLMTFGQMPGAQPGYEDKIMHALLATPELTLMASDGSPGQAPKKGDDVTLSLSGDDAAKLSGWFQKLSAGGSVIVPLGPQAWGDTFGMVDDRFGMRWMVNITGTK